MFVLTFCGLITWYFCEFGLLFAVLFGVGLLVYVFVFYGFVIGVSLAGLVGCCVCFFIPFGWFVGRF